MRNRKPQEQWMVLVKEYKASGLNLTSWCKEKGKFKWPSNENEVKSITERELRWLLDGLSIEQPKAHKEVTERLLI